MQTQVLPHESFNYTSSTSRILKDNYNYREKVGAMNYTRSLTTKLFASHGLVDPIKNIGRPTLYKKTVRSNRGRSNSVKSSSPYLPPSRSSPSFRFAHKLFTCNV